MIFRNKWWVDIEDGYAYGRTYKVRQGRFPSSWFEFVKSKEFPSKRSAEYYVKIKTGQLSSSETKRILMGLKNAFENVGRAFAELSRSSAAMQGCMSKSRREARRERSRTSNQNKDT